jgi:hypothetical protein
MEELNPQEAMPDPEQFVKDFNDKYIDDESKQAQDLLDYIRSATEDAFIYLSAFFNYVALGECYTYSEINGDKIIKENVPVIEAFPIPNNNFFIPLIFYCKDNESRIQKQKMGKFILFCIRLALSLHHHNKKSKPNGQVETLDIYPYDGFGEPWTAC